MTFTMLLVSRLKPLMRLPVTVSKLETCVLCKQTYITYAGHRPAILQTSFFENVHLIIKHSGLLSNLPRNNMNDILQCSRLNYATSTIKPGKKKQEQIVQPAKLVPKAPKRPPRKVPVLKEPEVPDKVTSYAVAEEIKIEKLAQAFEQEGLYTAGKLPEEVEDAIYVKAKHPAHGEEMRDIFIFREGSVIFWNLSPVETAQQLKLINQYCEDLYSWTLSVDEMERMNFQFTESCTHLSGDTIYLCNTEENVSDQVLEKYTYSNALSQTVKLAIWENALDNSIVFIKQMAEDLKEGRGLKLSRKNLLQKLGELFDLRQKVNLSSDLLGLPDFYWNREQMEDNYHAIRAHLNIDSRTSVLNEKIGHCCQLTETLCTNLNDKHHVRLEWMIIALITVEVAIELFHYFIQDNQKFQNMTPADLISFVKKYKAD